jgi:hypothetical protein
MVSRLMMMWFFSIFTEATAADYEMDKAKLILAHDQGCQQLSKDVNAACAELTVVATVADAQKHIANHLSAATRDMEEDASLKAEIQRIKANDLALKRLAREEQDDKDALQAILADQQEAQNALLEQRLQARRRKHEKALEELEDSKHAAMDSVHAVFVSVEYDSPAAPCLSSASQSWVRATLELLQVFLQQRRH